MGGALEPEHDFPKLTPIGHCQEMSRTQGTGSQTKAEKPKVPGAERHMSSSEFQVLGLKWHPRPSCGVPAITNKSQENPLQSADRNPPCEELVSSLTQQRAPWVMDVLLSEAAQRSWLVLGRAPSTALELRPALLCGSLLL